MFGGPVARRGKADRDAPGCPKSNLGDQAWVAFSKMWPRWSTQRARRFPCRTPVRKPNPWFLGSRCKISGEEKSCDEIWSRDGQATMVGRIICYALEEGCLVCSRVPLAFFSLSLCLSYFVGCFLLLMLLLLLSYNLLLSLLSNSPPVCPPATVLVQRSCSP